MQTKEENGKKKGTRKRRKNNSWENLQGFRYAHRGLFHQPASASRKPVMLTGAAHFRVESEKTDKTARIFPEQTKAYAGQPLWKEDIARWKAEGRKIVPENSMKAFRGAVRHGFGSELDVHLTADGRLVVFHDTNLLRMTGVNGQIEKMTWPELSRLRLLDTTSRIPLLEEVLALYTSDQAATGIRITKGARDAGGIGITKGTSDARGIKNTKGARDTVDIRNEKAAKSDPILYLPLIIELKAEGNVQALCQSVMETIDRYPALNYCIESFDPRVVFWFRRHRPDVIRGQLTENFMKSREAVREWGHIMTFGMWSVVPDILSDPDFIASKFCDRRNIFIRLSHRLGVRQVNWIIRNQRDFDVVDREGGLGIFERFMPDIDKPVRIPSDPACHCSDKTKEDR